MRNFVRRILSKPPIEKSKNVFEIAEFLSKYDETRETKGIVANVELSVSNTSDQFREDLQKFEGTYPLSLEFGQYRILYNKKPKKGLPTIKAVVDEGEQNIRFARGIRKDIINKYNYLHRRSSVIHNEYPMLEVDVVPHANSGDNYPELDIKKGECIYILSENRFWWFNGESK